MTWRTSKTGWVFRTRRQSHKPSSSLLLSSLELSDTQVYAPYMRVRELQALVAPKHPQGVLVPVHAGRVINRQNKSLLGTTSATHHLQHSTTACGANASGLGVWVQGSGFRVQGSGFRVQGSGFRVQGREFRV